MDIPYPSQHTMSSNDPPASEMSFERLRCCITKKEERKAGGGCVCVCGGGGGGGWGGVGDRLESHIETHSIFVVFLLHLLLLFLYGWWGEVK